MPDAGAARATESLGRADPNGGTAVAYWKGVLRFGSSNLCLFADGPAGAGGGGSAVAGGGAGGCRLNLLLSCASWRSDDQWASTLPRLLEPIGVSSLHARSAREAERVIRSQPVHIAVVDLALPIDEAGPDDGGARVLEMLARMDSPPPTVVVKSPRTMRDEQRELTAALRWGAFAVVDRYAADLEQMLQVMHRLLERFYAGRWPSGGAGGAGAGWRAEMGCPRNPPPGWAGRV